MTAKSINLAMLLIAGLATCIHGKCAESSSSPTAVWAKPDESLQWKTIMSASAPVTLNWPVGAASARLTVSWHGKTLGASTVSDTSAKTTTLPLGTLPSVLEDEHIVDVSIEYLNGSDSVLDSASARLGYVTGVGSGVTRLITVASGKPWSNVDKSAVLQIPEDATALTVDRATQNIGTPPGWWEWSGIASGPHDLELDTASGDYMASLQRYSDGTIMTIW